MKRYIRSNYGDRTTGIFYKNVDICDLPYMDISKV